MVLPGALLALPPCRGRMLLFLHDLYPNVIPYHATHGRTGLGDALVVEPRMRDGVGENFLPYHPCPGDESTML